MEDLAEVCLVFGKHFLGFEQRVVAVAEDVDEPGVEDAVGVMSSGARHAEKFEKPWKLADFSSTDRSRLKW